MKALAVSLIVAFGSFAFSAAAEAAPSVKVKAQFVPIRGFAKTGNISGAGAALKTEILIESTEYGGHPPPVEDVTVHFPTGTHINTSGFTACADAVLIERKEPAGCPKASSAGPPGYANGFVVFGGETVREELSIESFFAPAGGVNFFLVGHKPAIIEVTSKGRYTSLGSSGGFGPTFLSEVPLVETVPGADDASAEKIVTQVGAANKHGKKTVYYITLPKKCPKGGLALQVGITFGAPTFPTVTSSATYKAPCPKKA